MLLSRLSWKSQSPLSRTSQSIYPPLEDHLGPFEIIGHRDINDIPFHDNRRWQRKIQLESLKGGRILKFLQWRLATSTDETAL